jgi:hypothetical protein
MINNQRGGELADPWPSIVLVSRDGGVLKIYDVLFICVGKFVEEMSVPFHPSHIYQTNNSLPIQTTKDLYSPHFRQYSSI